MKNPSTTLGEALSHVTERGRAVLSSSPNGKGHPGITIVGPVEDSTPINSGAM